MTSPVHAGVDAGRTGSTVATAGDSSLSQTFAVPAGGGTLSFWYRITCPAKVNQDWATATLRDNVTGITTTLLARTCTNTGAWVPRSLALTAQAGHSVTLTLASHDDNAVAAPTSTLYDDVVFTASGAAATGSVRPVSAASDGWAGRDRWGRTHLQS